MTATCHAMAQWRSSSPPRRQRMTCASRQSSSRHLWTRTDLPTADVDVAEIYDGFSFNALSWLEALGFCEVGEAKDFLEGGKRIAMDGELPMNTHGGQVSP